MVRECLECKSQIFKVESCNKMTCPNCKCRMCYICGKEVSNYSHFFYGAKPIDGKCALYSDKNSLHTAEINKDTEVLGQAEHEETLSRTCTPNVPPKKKRNGTVCCVVDCFSRGGRGDGVSFFRFPKEDLQQRKAWIKAVKRINPDRTTWNPKDWSLVCSKHFIGGVSSKFQDHPDYTPTIFPTSHVAPKDDEDIQRFQRVSFKF
jgi:hypothetical protein